MASIVLYTRCTLAHRKRTRASRSTRSASQSAAATRRRRRRRTRRPAAPLTKPRRARGRRGRDMVCAVASKRFSCRARAARARSRRPLDGQRARAPPPPRPRSQRRRQVPPLTGPGTAYKAHRTIAWSARTQRHGTQPSFASFAAMRRCAARIRPGEQVLQQHGSRLLPGRAVGGGTARPGGPKRHRSGGPTTVGCRYVSSSQSVSRSRLHNQLLARHTRLQPGVTNIGLGNY